MNKIDMTGWIMKEHGVPNSKLTILYELQERKNKRIIWHCKCECGNECDINGIEIRNGHSKSCGCMQGKSESKIIDLKGQRFGKLVVIERAENTKQGQVQWKCKCDCGNETIVRGYQLTQERIKSCGCINSKGEEKISQILRKNNISFEKQKTFNDCRNPETNILFRFDFYINKQYIIEYDGEQHFIYRENTKGWNTKENFEKTQQYDNFKNQYCFEHNIPIIRIPYTHLKDICLEDLIPETSQFLLKPEG